MVWQPTGHGGVAPDQETRVGAYRPSMTSNPLLARAELGKIKQSTFTSNHTSSSHVFGYTPSKDPEGAREVTMLWKEHKGTKPSSQTHPKADFVTLNRMAVDNGLATAKELPTFRKDNLVTLKAPEEKPKKQPGLPSAKNPRHTYGMASAYRTAETVRNNGPTEPVFKHLVQGAYYDEWLRTNLHKEATSSGGRGYIPPAPTKAVLGHSYGASRYLQPPNHEEPWKMSKFKTVGPKVTQYSGGSFKANAFQHHHSNTAAAEASAAQQQQEYEHYMAQQAAFEQQQQQGHEVTNSA